MIQANAQADLAASKEALAERLTDLMQRVLRRTRPLLAEELSEVELTMPQYRTLALLTHGPARVCDLAEALGIRPPTASGIVDRLVAKGLVDRRPGATDRRSVSCVLTAAGRNEIDRRFHISRKRVRSIVDNLSRDALAEILHGMEILAREASAGIASESEQHPKSIETDHPIADRSTEQTHL